MINTAKYMDATEGLAVFYVDDDYDDLDTFRDIITEINVAMPLHTMDNGDKLLHVLDNPPPSPQVIFLDLNMPGKNGIEILKEIRQTNNAQELPIVVLSTSRDEYTVNLCRKIGANYYIPKANDYAVLKGAIDFALKIDWKNFDPVKDGFLHKT